MKILNLGCGTKASSHPEVINIDWSISLRFKKNHMLRFLTPLFIRGDRLQAMRSLPANIMVHNVAKGIPFESNSIDFVYHSHLLEHLDTEVAKTFLLEIKRVLKPGGIQRIVVPDLEKACRAYVSHLAISESNPIEAEKHDAYVAAFLEQAVRKEAFVTSQQPPIRRRIENAILGDARKRGETHQWMYDRINLGALLSRLGYRNPQIRSFSTSLIPNWNQYGLDQDEDGLEYKPDSLYVEVFK
jgi:SAM-dependent methyltransferase